MLKKLIIENFQSHEKTELNLDPGVNVITGVSQSGKTAILRALYWLLHNRPSGDRMRSNFAEGATKVMIETAEGDQIWHVKDSKQNSYTIGDNLFDKIGKDIPDMVQRALRVSELNVQKQLDEPFLVTSSAGEVAKTINRITRLEMVDNWVTDLTQTINSTNREIGQLQTEIESHAEKIKSYRILTDLQPLLDRLKEVDQKVANLTRKHNSIAYLIEDIKRIGDEYLKYGSARDYIQSVVYDYNKVQIEIDKRSERAKVARSSLGAYQTAQRLKSASELIKKAVDFEERKAELNRKSKIITNVVNSRAYLDKAQKIVDSFGRLVKENLSKLKQCPTCLQPITDSVVKKIVGGI